MVRKTHIYVLIYLLSIVCANLLVARFGPYFSIINAIIFIGLDITLRDKLHEYWNDNNLKLKMAALIFSGGLLSYLLNNSVFIIAVASTVAFSLAAITDFIVYKTLYKKNWYIKTNISNIASSLVDSFLFPIIAFGFPILFLVVLGQLSAKLLGGFIYTFLLKEKKNGINFG